MHMTEYVFAAVCSSIANFLVGLPEFQNNPELVLFVWLFSPQHDSEQFEDSFMKL
jgi:hypothetical protein